MYSYDKELRMHLSNFPECNWGVILQQAWVMCLKDQVNHSQGAGSGKFANKSKKEICQRFNHGQCVAGRACKYDHQCLECGKFGHGIHICCNKGNATPSAPQDGTSKASVVPGNQAPTNPSRQ